MPEEQEVIGLLFRNPTDRRLLAGFLEGAGFVPRLLSPAAVESQAWAGVHLFLADSNSARRFGEELLHRKKTSSLFLPLLVAIPEKAPGREWLDYGFDDCLRLPTTGAELTARLRTLLRIRRLSREIRRKSESTFRALVESSADHIFMLSPEGVYLSSNDQTKDLGFQSGRELTGKHLCDVYPPVVAELYGEKISEVLTGGGSLSFEHSLTREGETLYHLDTLFPIFEEGRIEAVGGLCRNITKLKLLEEEERKHREHLLQVQKMEAIGTLAGGIAHDFNNILSAILGYTDLALTTIDDGSPQQEYLREIFNAGGRARDLVRQILTFSRAGAEEQKPVDILPIVKEALKLLRATLPSSIEIRPRLDAEKAVILADTTQIHQIVMNLCTNASHAIGDAIGTIEVQLREKALTDPLTLRFKELTPGRYVQLTVSDTGRGIPPELINKIFEPYFTTKKKGKGTGLGLAVVHGIVQSCGGALTVYSEPGKGSIFHVYLPLIKTGRPEPGEVKKTSLPTGRERILFVDDEETLTTLGEQILKRLGYTVTTTTSSTHALERFQSSPDDFDLVITDLTMPAMRGDELSAELIKIRPDIPVILCTGFSEQMTAGAARKIGVRKYVMKPMTVPELAAAVREVLDEKVPS